jgi:SAM-dependent methyltransferase
MPTSRDSTIDVLVSSWEAMSEHYLAGRSVLLESVVDHLTDHLTGRRGTVVELGSGPGTLVTRLAEAIPTADLVAIEIDPVLSHVHRLGPARRLGDRIRQVDADLTDPCWRQSVPAAVDAVLAVQVLHYFPPTRFASLLGEIRSVLVRDGIFVHVDHVPSQSATIETSNNSSQIGVDPWDAWWAAARACPDLDEQMIERDRRIALQRDGSAEFHPDEQTLRALFAATGLDVELVEQRVGQSRLTIVTTSAERAE